MWAEKSPQSAPRFVGDSEGATSVMLPRVSKMALTFRCLVLLVATSFTMGFGIASPSVTAPNRPRNTTSAKV